LDGAVTADGSGLLVKLILLVDDELELVEVDGLLNEGLLTLKDDELPKGLAIAVSTIAVEISAIARTLERIFFIGDAPDVVCKSRYYNTILSNVQAFYKVSPFFLKSI
jgi:hypothetical protein